MRREIDRVTIRKWISNKYPLNSDIDLVKVNTYTCLMKHTNRVNFNRKDLDQDRTLDHHQATNQIDHKTDSIIFNLIQACNVFKT